MRQDRNYRPEIKVVESLSYTVYSWSRARSLNIESYWFLPFGCHIGYEKNKYFNEFSVILNVRAII